MSHSIRAQLRRTRRSHLTKYERHEQLGANMRKLIREHNAQRRAAFDISFAKLLKIGPFRPKPEEKEVKGK